MVDSMEKQNKTQELIDAAIKYSHNRGSNQDNFLATRIDFMAGAQYQIKKSESQLIAKDASISEWTKIANEKDDIIKGKQDLINELMASDAVKDAEIKKLQFDLAFTQESLANKDTELLEAYNAERQKYKEIISERDKSVKRNWVLGFGTCFASFIEPLKTAPSEIWEAFGLSYQDCVDAGCSDNDLKLIQREIYPDELTD